MRKIVKTVEGSRFDLNKAVEVCHINFKHDDVEGKDLWRTASDNYVIYSWSRFQGVNSTWREITEEEAKGICLDNLSFEDACLEFPELEENYKDDI